MKYHTEVLACTREVGELERRVWEEWREGQINRRLPCVLLKHKIRGAMAWGDMECPSCGEVVHGEDLGDHPGYLSFLCECGNEWDKQFKLPDIYQRGDT